MPIPGSRNIRANDSEADCRAWSVGIGIKIELDATFNPTGGSPASGPSMLADFRACMT